MATEHEDVASVPLMLRLRPAMARALDAYAERTGVNRTEVIRMALIPVLWPELERESATAKERA